MFVRLPTDLPPIPFWTLTNLVIRIRTTIAQAQPLARQLSEPDPICRLTIFVSAIEEAAAAIPTRASLRRLPVLIDPREKVDPYESWYRGRAPPRPPYPPSPLPRPPRPPNLVHQFANERTPNIRRLDPMAMGSLSQKRTSTTHQAVCVYQCMS